MDSPASTIRERTSPLPDRLSDSDISEHDSNSSESSSMGLGSFVEAVSMFDEISIAKMASNDDFHNLLRECQNSKESAYWSDELVKMIVWKGIDYAKTDLLLRRRTKVWDREEEKKKADQRKEERKEIKRKEEEKKEREKRREEWKKIEMLDRLARKIAAERVWRVLASSQLPFKEGQ